MILVPRLLAFYKTIAIKLTHWENHPRQSSYDRSLTLKTFALAAIVAYGGLALSAFVYVPFGAQIMRFVQSYLTTSDGLQEGASITGATKYMKLDPSGAQAAAVIQALKVERLKGQVFAFTVTNQVINFAQEVVIPWVLEGVEGMKAKGQLKVPGTSGSANGKKKRVEWEDDSRVAGLSTEERAVLDAARTESTLPDYELFGAFCLRLLLATRVETSETD